jgi:hypothetical protein
MKFTAAQRPSQLALRKEEEEKKKNRTRKD